MLIGVRFLRMALIVSSFGYLAGCGSGTPASPPVGLAPFPAALSGNWLLTGTLPFINPLHLGGASGFGLAVTFAVTGNGIVGGVTENFPCGSFTSGRGDVVSGAIAADGTFTAQSSLPAPSASLQLTGKAPAAGGASWSGTYSFNPSNSACPQTVAGAFTAVRIADVTGVYAASAPVSLQSAVLGSSPQAVSLTFTLQQGGVLPGTTSVDPELLSGSVQIGGSSYLSSGIAATGPGGGVLGTTLVISFALNDGSMMRVFGDIEDTGSNKLVIESVYITGGAQGTAFAGPFEVVRR